MDQVHIAITRHVKRGREAEFEAALREFARESLHYPGTMGVLMVGPVSEQSPSEFGILRSFENDAASKAFYSSDTYQRWRDRVAEFAEGEPILRPLSGLEAFFREESRSLPPRWKMALLTWLGVFPTALLLSNILPRLLGNLPHVAFTAIFAAVMVATLTWGVMPLLTRLLRGWLHKDKA